MGRNKRDPARSKFRASSSSAAASLLQTPVASAVGFGGFVGGSRVDLPPSTDGEHSSTDVDGDAALHLKRLSKKDPTTKLKALTALTAFFEERPPAEVSALLPPWVFEYRRLVQDSSRQVRQSTHVAMASLATCVGRGLAPHLRSLMGDWWIAQFDPSREVSEAAKSSFQVAFPGQKKWLEALLFCENEIVIHLDENLKLTPQTISDKATPLEESIEKHERVVSSSLLALAALLDVLVESAAASSSITLGQDSATAATAAPGANASSDRAGSAKSKTSIKEGAVRLCRSHRFLQQFVKSKSSRVRAAAYQALRSLVQRSPEVFRGEKDMDVAAPTILGAFAEKDPSCHQPMWDVALLFTKGFPQAWEATFAEKAVFPRLWSLLQHGCYGSQQISYPYLLPLISLIPPKAMTSAQNTLTAFFSSLWQGRTAPPQAASPDYLALLKTLQECLIWTVLNAKRFSHAEGSEAAQLQHALVDGVVLRFLWPGYMARHQSNDPTTLASSKEQQQQQLGESNNNVAGVAASDYFLSDLGSCMVHVIQTLSAYDGDDHKLLGPFWEEFQSLSFNIIEESGDLWKISGKEEGGSSSSSSTARLTELLLLFGTKTNKGENTEHWSLVQVVKPFIAKSFPSVRSTGDPGSVRLIARLTSSYGPSVFSALATSDRLEDGTHQREQQSADFESDEDLVVFQYFKEDLVPWCLNGDSIGPKADLLLAFFGNSKFQESWDLVIRHVTGWLEGQDSDLDVSQVGILASLLEKVTETRDDSSSSGNEGGDKISKGNGLDGEAAVPWWQSSRIDSAAVRVVSSIHLSHPDCLRLLRCALGGKSARPMPFPLVSEQAAAQILELLMRRLIGILSASALKWVRSAPSLLMNFGASDDDDSVTVLDYEEVSPEGLQLAVSALSVLGSSIFSLVSLDRDHAISGKLLAALFCLKWACSRLGDKSFNDKYDSSAEDVNTEFDSEEEEMGVDDDSSSLIHDVSFDLKMVGNFNNAAAAAAGHRDDDEEEEHEEEVSFTTSKQQGWRDLRESLLSVWKEISPTFCKTFGALSRFRVRQVLIMCLRMAVFDDDDNDADYQAVYGQASRCASWAQELLRHTCEGSDEVSTSIELLIAPKENTWPWWVRAPSPSFGREQPASARKPLCTTGQTASQTMVMRHDRFAAFLDHLCRTFGPEEIFLGSDLQPGPGLGSGPGPGSEMEREQYSSGRPWHVVELLCTWEWSGGTAPYNVLPFLWSLARSKEGSREYNLLWGTFHQLFLGSSNSIETKAKPMTGKQQQQQQFNSFSSAESSSKKDDWTSSSSSAEDYSEEPFLRALLVLLKGLLEREDGWRKEHARLLFRRYVSKQEDAHMISEICGVRILPHVLFVLMPALRKRAVAVEEESPGGSGGESSRSSSSSGDEEQEWQSYLQTAVSVWIQEALIGPPLVAAAAAWKSGSSDSQPSVDEWIQVVVECFPLNSAGGEAAIASASSTAVTSQETELLLALLRKQFSREAMAAVAALVAEERRLLSHQEEEKAAAAGASASAASASSRMMMMFKNLPAPVEGTLAKLVAVATGYCWSDLGMKDWDFILKRVRGWLQEAVVEAEEFTEAVVDAVKESVEAEAEEEEEEEEKERATTDAAAAAHPDTVLAMLESSVGDKWNTSLDLYSTAVAIYSLLRGLKSRCSTLGGGVVVGSTEEATLAMMKEADWENVEMRVLEDILRVFLAIGLAESVAAGSSAGEEGAEVVASWRQLQSRLWDNVAEVALSASSEAREAAIRAVDLWGVGGNGGAISSLYAILFSPQPILSLQWAAYRFLSTPRILQLAITCGAVAAVPVVPSDDASEFTVTTGDGGDAAETLNDGEGKSEDVEGSIPPSQIMTSAQIRPELAMVLQSSHSDILQSPLTSPLWVRYLLGWALFLTRLHSLTALSPTREKLVHYVQDVDISPVLLDCLFQHIPLEPKKNGGKSGSRRRREVAATAAAAGGQTSSSAAAAGAAAAAAGATRAAATGSVEFAVEGLWPVEKESMVTLAGAIYGMMLLVLPACVRVWFTGLRDKALASAIEAFTTAHCSPQLLANEFSQVQASVFDDESLSIRPNRSQREVTAVYKKEDAGIDIVIRIPIPSCYPLRAVEVEFTKRMGINETLLRKWVLSMAAFLRNQNGAVSEAIQVWKKNVDREFEGVEECPICYSIIHTFNHNLPRLACKTCRHKFHSACLYKWFSTSHQSTCPLCKTPF